MVKTNISQEDFERAHKAIEELGRQMATNIRQGIIDALGIKSPSEEAQGNGHTRPDEGSN